MMFYGNIDPFKEPDYAEFFLGLIVFIMIGGFLLSHG